MKRHCSEKKRKEDEIENAYCFILEKGGANDFKEFKQLISADFDYSAKYKNYYLINSAIIVGKLDLVKGFLENGAKITDRSNMPLMNAVALKDITCTRILLQSGEDVNIADRNGFSPLHLAVFNSNIPMVKLLLAYGADVDRRAFSPLSFAHRNRHQEIIALLETAMAERLLSKTVVGGIKSRKTPFRAFLADGVCDARLLIHVASFI